MLWLAQRLQGFSALFSVGVPGKLSTVVFATATAAISTVATTLHSFLILSTCLGDTETGQTDQKYLIVIRTQRLAELVTHSWLSLQVRCRTPEELQQGISSQESRETEQRFFREHPELKHIDEEYKGIPALSRKLVQIQDQCIQSHLPTLQKEVIGATTAALQIVIQVDYFIALQQSTQ